MITTTPRRSRRMLLCGAIALVGLGLTSVTVSDVAHAAAPATPATSVVQDDTTSSETDWVAESNAEQDQLAAYLTAHGIAFTIEQDGTGQDGTGEGAPWRWVVVDDADQAANDAVDDFYWSLYPVAQDEIDAENADTDALAAYLRDHGIAVTSSTDRHGFHITDWNYDDPAAETVVEDFYWEQYPTSPEEIAAINAEAEGEVAYLTANGFAASIETDRHGIESSVYDYEDEAIWNALDAYWSTVYGD